MTDPTIEQRMHDVLDGVATPEEREALERDIAGDPALGARFAELGRMFDALGRVPMVDPPAGMHADLMRAIERERPATPGWLEAFAAAFRARPVPAFAMAFVSVAAAGLLLYAGTGGRGLPGGSELPVSGTLAPPGVLTPAGTTTLEAGGARIVCRSFTDGRDLRIEIDGDAPAGTRLALRYDEATWTPSAPAGAIPGHLTLLLDGRVSAELRFSRAAGTATAIVATLEAEEEVNEATLPVTRPGGND